MQFWEPQLWFHVLSIWTKDSFSWQPSKQTILDQSSSKYVICENSRRDAGMKLLSLSLSLSIAWSDLAGTSTPGNIYNFLECFPLVNSLSYSWNVEVQVFWKIFYKTFQTDVRQQLLFYNHCWCFLSWHCVNTHCQNVEGCTLSDM